jgi:hypothetical protein
MASDKQDDNKDSMPFWRGGIKAIDDLVQNVTASKAGGSIPASSKDTGASKRVVNVPIDREAIKKKAEEIAGWKNPYNTVVWLFAEAETRLADAYVTVLDGTNAAVQVDASKVIDAPDRAATESLAKAIYSRRPTLNEVHWFLAERRYIYEKVKSAK